jgi:hypothetical protein
VTAKTISKKAPPKKTVAKQWTDNIISVIFIRVIVLLIKSKKAL